MATKYRPHTLDTAPSASGHLTLCAIVFRLIWPPHFGVMSWTYQYFPLLFPQQPRDATALLTSSVPPLCCILLQATIYLPPSEPPVAKCIIDNWAWLVMESVQQQNRPSGWYSQAVPTIVQCSTAALPPLLMNYWLGGASSTRLRQSQFFRLFGWTKVGIVVQCTEFFVGMIKWG